MSTHTHTHTTACSPGKIFSQTLAALGEDASRAPSLSLAIEVHLSGSPPVIHISAVVLIVLLQRHKIILSAHLFVAGLRAFQEISMVCLSVDAEQQRAT
jgi:hypothetical protein